MRHAFFSFLLFIAIPAGAETWAGTLRVIDADTVDIGSPAKVRLLGIDAAEGDQTCRSDAGALRACSAMATAAARALPEGRDAVCTVQGYDRYGRALATCRVEGSDMGADRVRRGLAQVYRGDAPHAEDEKEARLLERGLWRYEMISPAAWRAEQDTTPAATHAIRPAIGGCAIKGSISENGWIYHMPGMEYYDRTTIRGDRGERWFCTEREAQAAGWRRARR